MKCLYRSCGKSRRKHPGIKLYNFPVKDQERCKKWIINSGNNVALPVSAYDQKGICENHFVREHFVNESRHRLIHSAYPIHHEDMPVSVQEEAHSKSWTNDQNDMQLVYLRNDLFTLNTDSKIHLCVTKGNKDQCYSKKNLNKNKTTDKGKRKTQNRRNKPVVYYINSIADLLSIKETELYDCQFEWQKNEDIGNRKCYSRNPHRKDNSVVGHCNKDLKSEREDNETMLKNQQMNNDNVQTEIYMEEDKTCIQIDDLPILLKEEDNEDHKNDTPIFRKKVKTRQRLKAIVNYMRRTPETEKFVHYINKSRGVIYKLRNQLKECRKKLKKFEEDSVKKKVQGEQPSKLRSVKIS